MKTTGVSSIPKFGLLDFLGHPIVDCSALDEENGHLPFMQQITKKDFELDAVSHLPASRNKVSLPAR